MNYFQALACEIDLSEYEGEKHDKNVIQLRSNLLKLSINMLRQNKDIRDDAVE